MPKLAPTIKPLQIRFLAQIIAAFAFYLTPPLVILFIWYPVYQATYTPRVQIDDRQANQAVATPEDGVLDELNNFRLLDVNWKSKDAIISTASHLLSGKMQIPPYESVTIRFPFQPVDLSDVHMSSSLRLQFTALVVPDTLIEAYEATGRMAYLLGARDDILSWASYEQRFWLPRTYLLEDHAMAGRVMVLTRFWRVYRHSAIYQRDVARRILLMLARTEVLLAKPELFTYATNHGIMQNLALLHASVAFPSLPHTRYYQRLAVERLSEQIPFYIDDEGVVLEHSPGYQRFGVELLSMAFRYLQLAQQQVPPEWVEKYGRAQKVYASFRRPDGSLPMLGDTDSEEDAAGPPLVDIVSNARGGLKSKTDWIPPNQIEFFPIGGYSVWWTGLNRWPKPVDLSQTAIAWSNFSGHAHKHADELSVVFWAGGQTWWSNVGDWPYGTPERHAAESWAGSDAPHFLAESTGSSRTAYPLKFGSSGTITAIDLERRGPGKYVARRQVISSQGLWLVLDSTAGESSARTTATWTTGLNVNLTVIKKDRSSFSFEATTTKQKVTGCLLFPAGTTLRLLSGSLHPFAGWQVINGIPQPTSAIVLEQAPNSWSALVWSWNAHATDANDPPGKPAIVQWENAEHWQIAVSLGSIHRTLTRSGSVIHIRTDGPSGSTTEILNLESPPIVNNDLDRLRSNFLSISSRYHTLRPVLERRLKLTYLLVSMLLVQIILVMTFRKAIGKHLELLQWLIVGCWIAGAIGLYTFVL